MTHASDFEGFHFDHKTRTTSPVYQEMMDIIRKEKPHLDQTSCELIMAAHMANPMAYKRRNGAPVASSAPAPVVEGGIMIE
jgi:hypothetical protein